MFTQDQPARRINTLNELNTALLRLNPSISGIALSMLEVKGASMPMLDAEIARNTLTLYDGIKRTEALAALKPGVVDLVETYGITFAYDPHGDKHFPGGPDGTKFRGTKAEVNPFIVDMIRPLVGRIRRHANGQNKTYYLTSGPNKYTNGQAMAVQVDYVYSPEKIGYHGYPRDVTAYTLSETLGGPAIP
jgi:hypothetical protein